MKEFIQVDGEICFMKKIKGILLENGTNYLTNEEYQELYEQLDEQGIEMTSVEKSGPQASLNDICIFFSENFVELLITGLILPMTYDAIKKAVCFCVAKIAERVKILQSGKIRPAQPCIRFLFDESEVIAPIPNGLTDEQLDKYFDTIVEVSKKLYNGPIKKNEVYILEGSESPLQVEIKSLQQYACEQMEKKHAEFSSEDVKKASGSECEEKE